MKIQVFSDTHGMHEQFFVQDGVDMLIHAGDFGDVRAPGQNANECALFLNWYAMLKPKYKLLIAGNHDIAIERRMINPRDFKELTYLEHETVEIEGIKIFGSPYTPSFGVGWAFNKAPHKLHDYWQEIAAGTDIVVTHGPPKGILDLSINRDNKLEFCGDAALANHLARRVKPKYSVFGHIHSSDYCVNQGIRIHNSITYINASCVTDGNFSKGLTSNGVIIEI